MPALAFYIDSPLQSWGLSSKFDVRQTNRFPTKSAVVGLIAAALGIDKHGPDEGEALSAITDCRLTVVRMDKLAASPRLVDFHTVGGGYDKTKSTWEKMSIPRKASGAPFGTVLTRRSYLTDASFAAILEGSRETLDTVRDALLDPKWGVWFGRKHCLPASPLSPCLQASPQLAFDTLREVIAQMDAFYYRDRETDTPLKSYEFQEELETMEAGSVLQKDQPASFGAHHGSIPLPYAGRAIRHHRPIGNDADL